MVAQILPFPSTPEIPPIGLFFRIGSAHRKLADLHAAGKLPIARAVFDASRLRLQKEFARELRDSGAEIVLDTEVAELSTARRFQTHAKAAPWSKSEEGRPLSPQDFQGAQAVELARSIARFSVENQITTVISPSHYLGDPTFDGWLGLDLRFCETLRRALDIEGGQNIALDYAVIVPNSDIKDVGTRGDLASGLAHMPIDNVWIRASGLESVSGPLKIKRYLTALSGLQNLGKPLVADYLGGLTGLAALAFGGISGLAHGIGERERFSAADWHKPPDDRDDDEGFGPTVRLEIPLIGKSATVKEMDVLMSAPGGRKACSCADRRCCQHGYEDMVKSPRAHAAYQAIKAVESMQLIPAVSRAEYFLRGPIADADKAARQIKQLKPNVAEAAKAGVDISKLMSRFESYSRQLESVRTTLDRYHDEMPAGAGQRSRAITRRLPTDNANKKKNNES